MPWSEDIPNLGSTWISLKRWRADLPARILYTYVSSASLSILQLFFSSSTTLDLAGFFFISALGDYTTLPPHSEKAAFLPATTRHRLSLELSNFSVLLLFVSYQEME